MKLCNHILAISSHNLKAKTPKPDPAIAQSNSAKGCAEVRAKAGLGLMGLVSVQVPGLSIEGFKVDMRHDRCKSCRCNTIIEEWLH